MPSTNSSMALKIKLRTFTAHIFHIGYHRRQVSAIVKSLYSHQLKQKFIGWVPG